MRLLYLLAMFFCNCKCSNLAQYLEKYMQPNVDPCHDFHAFVCGKPLDNNRAPQIDKEIQQHVRFLSSLRYHVQSTLTAPTDNTTHTWLMKARRFYKSCVDNSKILPYSTTKFSQVIEILKKLFEEDVPLPVTISGLRRILGFSFIFHVHSSSILLNGIDIDQSTFTLIDPNLYQKRKLVPKKYWSESYNEAYYFYSNITDRSQNILKSLNLWPVNLPAVFQLDHNLTSLIRVNDWGLDGSPQVQVFNMSQLENEYRHAWDWRQYFDAWLLNPSATFWTLNNINSASKFSLDSTSRFLIKQPIYVQQVAMLLKRTNRTIFLQYATLRLIHFLEQNFFKPIYSYNTQGTLLQSHEVYSTPGLLDTFQRMLSDESVANTCSKITTEMFPAINLINLDKHFITQNMRDLVSTVASKVKNEFKLHIEQAGKRWGRKQTAFALIKLEQLELNLIFPQALLVEAKVDELYDALSLSPTGDYMDSVIQYTTFFGSLSLSTSHTLFSFPYYPFYQHLLNAASVQPQLLQKPSFDPEWPLFAIYATIGNSIAHEMAHAFDSEGWHFSSGGHYIPTYDWPPHFTNLWTSQQQCLVSHYSFPHYPNPFPNGTTLVLPSSRTLDENSADVMGVHMAFAAFKQEEKNLDAMIMLNGKSYNQKQLFYISLARSLVYCTLDTEDNLLTAALTDRHSPGRFRLLGLVSSNDQFAQIFQCERSSAMKPQETECEIFP